MDYINFVISRHNVFILRTEPYQNKEQSRAIGKLLAEKFPANEGFRIRSETRSACIISEDIENDAP